MVEARYGMFEEGHSISQWYVEGHSIMLTSG